MTDRPAGQGGAFTIDKFLVTAGRMRTFAERYQGNLKQWASTNPKGWDDSLTGGLPENMDDVNILLGPNGKRGCNVVNQGGRTFWQGAVDGIAGEKSDFSKDVLDEKALNCVPWNMAAAVCAFDGGHLVSVAEMAWVYENRGRAGGSTAYPWQWNDTSSYSPNNADIRIVHRYSYQTPNPPADLRTVNGQYPLDHAFWIAPPGRRPTGANMHGVHGRGRQPDAVGARSEQRVHLDAVVGEPRKEPQGRLVERAGARRPGRLLRPRRSLRVLSCAWLFFPGASG